MTSLAAPQPATDAAEATSALRMRIGIGIAALVILAAIGVGFWYAQSLGLILVATASAGFMGALVATGVLIHMQQRRTTPSQATPSKAITLPASAADLSWETNLDGAITAISGRLIDKQGLSAEHFIGQHFLNIVKIETAERQKMLAAMDTAETYSDIQSLYQDPDGRLFYLSLSAAPKSDAAGDVSGYVGVATNITERVLNERRLRQLAENDTLTGLANRHRFNEQIRQDLSNNTSTSCLALFAIDLDGFKQINDTYGHQAGDALLNLVGKRLRRHVRDDDWAARLGGDEFMVVSRGVKGPMEACLMAARLIAVLAQPYKVGGVELRATASIGIACAPMHAREPVDLMKSADEALYKAKAEGRNRFSLYAEDQTPLESNTPPALH